MKTKKFEFHCSLSSRTHERTYSKIKLCQPKLLKDLSFRCKQIFTLLLASCWSTLCLHPMRHSHSPLEALRRPGLPGKSSSANSYTSKGCRDPSGEGSNAVADSWWLAVPLQWKNGVLVSCVTGIKYSLVCMCHCSECTCESVCATAVRVHRWLYVPLQWECTGESVCATAVRVHRRVCMRHCSESAQVSLYVTTVRVHRWVCTCHYSDSTQVSLYVSLQWQCTGESVCDTTVRVRRWVCMWHCSESAQVSVYVTLQWQCKRESVCDTSVTVQRCVTLQWDGTGESTRAAAGTVYRWA